MKCVQVMLNNDVEERINLISIRYIAARCITGKHDCVLNIPHL